MRGKDVYVVDKITGSRKRNGVRQYLVKWAGYPDSENTWENEENIFCKDLIRAYEELQKKQKTEKPPSKGKEREVKKRASEKKPSRVIFSRTVTNDWDDLVDKVISVSKGGSDGSFMVEILFKNGERGLLPVSQVHMRCPLHLLEYYESNLIFTEDDTSGAN